MHWTLPFILASMTSLILSLIGTKLLISYLAKRNIMDSPNQRSNHKTPTPRGGGIAIIGTVMLMYLTASLRHDFIIDEFLPILIAPIILAIISFIDDITPLPAKWRLLTQILVVTACTLLLFKDKLLFQGLLPAYLDKAIIIFAWVWFINLFNFMDGIDGITGSQTITICIGIIFISIVTSYDLKFAFFTTIIAFSTLGFLKYNWHPARIFMGDVGSISLGFLLGWLLLELALGGYLASAIIITLYYLADSGYIIIKRLLKGDKIWQPHSQHFYQIAVRNGQKHNQVVMRIANVNIILLAIAWIIALNPNLTIYGLVLASISVIILLYRLKHRAG